jgi:hypothetical protein
MWHAGSDYQFGIGTTIIYNAVGQPSRTPGRHHGSAPTPGCAAADRYSVSYSALGSLLDQAGSGTDVACRVGETLNLDNSTAFTAGPVSSEPGNCWPLLRGAVGCQGAVLQTIAASLGAPRLTRKDATVVPV